MNKANEETSNAYWTWIQEGHTVTGATMAFGLRDPSLGFLQYRERTPDFLYEELAAILKAVQAFGAESTAQNKDKLATVALDVMGAVFRRSPNDSTTKTQARFTALRAWRTTVARAKMIPPYIIATDAVLLGCASVNPSSKADLATVRGMGAAKIETYGDEILAALRSVQA
jgi:superfamily II DNA helicase RecQ